MHYVVIMRTTLNKISLIGSTTKSTKKFLTRNYDDRHNNCRLFKDEFIDKVLTKIEKIR